MLVEDRLERLNEIQNGIRYLSNRVNRYFDHYQTALKNDFTNNYIEKKVRKYLDALRGVDRLKSIFNRELKKIRYEG